MLLHVRSMYVRRGPRRLSEVNVQQDERLQRYNTLVRFQDIPVEHKLCCFSGANTNYKLKQVAQQLADADLRSRVKENYAV